MLQVAIAINLQSWIAWDRLQWQQTYTDDRLMQKIYIWYGRDPEQWYGVYDPKALIKSYRYKPSARLRLRCVIRSQHPTVLSTKILWCVFGANLGKNMFLQGILECGTGDGCMGGNEDGRDGRVSIDPLGKLIRKWTVLYMPIGWHI